MDLVKRGLIFLVVAFAVYSIVATPLVAANAVRSAGEGAQTVVRGVSEFFDALTP